MDQISLFVLLIFLILLDLIFTFFACKVNKNLSEERDYWKEKYEQLHLDQIQELLDDRDFGNND